MLKLASLLVILLGCPARGAWNSGQEQTSHPIVDEATLAKWRAFEDKPVKELHFSGLVRTQEQAVRWLVKTRAGESFSSEKMASDLQRLYNTGVLYDVSADLLLLPDNQLHIEITLKDKWTLLPVAGAQGGGGSVTYGGGLIDQNFAGYFISVMALGYNYNGIFSYDVSAFQEYLAGTSLMGSLDLSYNVNPTVIHYVDGSSAGDYSWYRQQQEIMIGNHFEDFRLFVYMDLFVDGLLSQHGVRAPVYLGTQYRIRPKIIFGKVDSSNFNEHGTEITLDSSSSNFFGPVPNYQTVTLALKTVTTLANFADFAFYLSTSAMSFAPPPYEFQIGGYSNVRGFISTRQTGPYMTYNNVEYRPLLYQSRWKLFDLDLVALQGCIFSDFGSAWGDSTLTGENATQLPILLWSAGVGFRLNFVKFAGAILRFDFARTIRPDEGLGFSFGVGQFF